MINFNYLTSLMISFLFFTLSDGYSQCFADRHNTSISSSWISCSISSSPNPVRARGHWILYEIDNVQTINSLRIWNLNHPDFTNNGAKRIAVDYIDNNGAWQEHGVFNLEEAEGSAFYEGQLLEMSQDIISDKILITILENHGGSCTGIAEVKLGLNDLSTATEDISDDHFDITIAPNPFADYTRIEVSDLEGKDIRYQVTNSLGQIVINEIVSTTGNTAKFSINGKYLASGNYFLKIVDGQKVSVRKLSHQVK